MTAINHALTGAVIGAAVHQPLLALPLAFVSHYVLDSLPHFGAGPGFIKTNIFKFMLLADFCLCLLLVIILAVSNTHHWFIISLCAFLATSPDLFWINNYRYALKNKLIDWKPGLHSRFASKIQWYEKPLGGLVELIWATSMSVLLIHLV
jgi:hypothetical protein